jgi:hypothetical protein
MPRIHLFVKSKEMPKKTLKRRRSTRRRTLKKKPFKGGYFDYLPPEPPSSAFTHLGPNGSNDVFYGIAKDMR